MQEELVYLGFVISIEGLKMDQDKVKEILEWPSPNNVFEVRSFHGLASFYTKFIINFNCINAPMLETIRKDKKPFMWTKEDEKSFQSLKKKVSEQPVVVLLDFNKPFQVRCDASGRSIGAVLSEHDRPISYFSGTYTKLKWKEIGQCKMLRKFSSTAYEVELPKDVGISPIFNVSYLYPYHEDESSHPTTQEEADPKIPWEAQLPKATSTIPERILDKRMSKKTRGKEYYEYLIKWKDHLIKD